MAPVENDLPARIRSWTPRGQAPGLASAAAAHASFHARRLGGDVRDVDAAARNDAAAGDARDWIVVATEGPPGVALALLGDYAERAVAAASGTVLVTRAACPAVPERVIVGVDLGPGAGEVLRAARAFAPEAQVILVHAQSVGYEGLLWRAGADAQAGELRLSSQHESMARLEALAAQAGLPADRCHGIVGRGHAADVVVRATEANGAGLIVVGRRGRTSFERNFVGSVARSVLAESPCPVLVVAGGAPAR